MEKKQGEFSWKEKKNFFSNKNKFIYFIIFLIVAIIGIIFYNWASSNVDRNSYVELLEWEAVINENNLPIWDKQKLSIWDVIKTTKEESLAVIEWWDWSVTRLWWNTHIEIDELYVSESVDRLNIAFELFSGKTWSNILSYIPWDSYFKQSFMDMEAAVRGTVYNVDLENDYLYVLDHSVDVTNQKWDTYEVSSKEPFSLSNFSFIQLETFLRDYRDSLFDQINRKMDSELISYLKSNINSKLEDIYDLTSVEISNIDPEKKQELYDKVITNYQNLNKFWTEDWYLFDLKLDLKEKLYWLSNQEEKALVAKSFSYDVKDATDNNNYESLNQILEKLKNNDININQSIKNYVENINYDNINSDLRNSIQNNYNTLKNSLNLDQINWQWIIDSANTVKDNFKESFWWGIVNFFKNLFN